MTPARLPKGSRSAYARRSWRAPRVDAVWPRECSRSHPTFGWNSDDLSVRATAIIPVKRFGQAKQRLLERLDRPQRATVVKAMLSDVLSAVTSAEPVERVILITGE